MRSLFDSVYHPSMINLFTPKVGCQRDWKLQIQTFCSCPDPFSIPRFSRTRWTLRNWITYCGSLALYVASGDQGNKPTHSLSLIKLSLIWFYLKNHHQCCRIEWAVYQTSKSCENVWMLCIVHT